MMKSWKFALIALLALSNVAEAGSLLGKQEPADYGKAMSQRQCQAVARNAIAPHLRNPGSAKYKWGKCDAQTMGANIFKKLPRQAGWGMNFYVNATNKWGRYTGYTQYQILIRDGQAIRRLRQTGRGSWEKF